MEKLIKCALNAKVNQLSIEGIIEVIYATSNPSVATELLLGIYEEPVFYTDHRISGKECVFDSFDKWSDTVWYTYTKNKQVHIYIKKGIDKSLINKDNYKEYEVPYKAGEIDSMYVTLDELVTEKSSMSASDWPQEVLSGPCMEEPLIAC